MRKVNQAIRNRVFAALKPELQPLLYSAGDDQLDDLMWLTFSHDGGHTQCLYERHEHRFLENLVGLQVADVLQVLKESTTEAARVVLLEPDGAQPQYEL